MTYDVTPALVFAAIVVAVVGVFFLGGLALMISIVLLGIAVLAVSGDLQARSNPPSTVPHPTRYACPNCGGDVYMGDTACASCGAKLAA